MGSGFLLKKNNKCRNYFNIGLESLERKQILFEILNRIGIYKGIRVNFNEEKMATGVPTGYDMCKYSGCTCSYKLYSKPSRT